MIDAHLLKNLTELLNRTEKDNVNLINYINSHELYGPILVEEDKIIRTIGPEANMLNHETVEEFNTQVDSIVKRIKTSSQNSINLLCEKYNDTYYLLDGNHTFEALKIIGTTQFSVIYSNDSVIHGKLSIK